MKQKAVWNSLVQVRSNQIFKEYEREINESNVSF